MNLESLPISSITVGERRRSDLGDIAGLAESLGHFGLFHPLVIDDNNVLVSGGRRLAAARELRWTHIDCRRFGALSEAERREIELEENLQRKDLTPYERSRTLARLADTAATADRETFRGESPRNPQGGRPEEPGSDRRVADRLGIDKRSIRDAREHVVAVETHDLPPETPQSVAIDYGKAVEDDPALAPESPPTIEVAKAVVQVFRSRQELEREQRREDRQRVQAETQAVFDTANRVLGTDPELERLTAVERFYTLIGPAEKFFARADPAMFAPNFGEGEYVHVRSFIQEARRWCDRMERQVEERTRHDLRVVGEGTGR